MSRTERPERSRKAQGRLRHAVDTGRKSNATVRIQRGLGTMGGTSKTKTGDRSSGGQG